MENSIEIETKDLLALSVILDDFEEFNNKVIELLNNSKTSNVYLKLLKISKGENIIGSKKIKEFYDNNIEIIDVINAYSNIGLFVANNYTINNKLNLNTQMFYEYLINNKENIKIILDLIIKVRRLGFNRIKLNTRLDFTEELYELHENPVLFNEFEYLDNMYAIPSYLNNTINYKTKDSTYEMVLKIDFDKITPVKISFNSLLYPERLPAEINKENTFDLILSLKKDIKRQYEALRESVDINISIDELKEKYDRVLNLAYLCNDLEIKKRLLTTLSDMKDELYELEYLGMKYNNNIINNYPLFSKETLDNEKKLELKRRKSSIN